MKKILLGLLGLCLPAFLYAQATFSVAQDTVRMTVGGPASVNDNITNLTGSNLSLRWSVIASDFPTDWRAPLAFGICDNALCRQNSSGAIWNGSSGSTYSSTYYFNAAHDSVGAFDLSLDFSTVTSAGVSHYVTVSITDVGSGYTHNETFVIYRPPLAVGNVNTVAADVVLYPNPARDEVNVVFDANADVKNIAVYNIIGKVMNVYKVNGDSANLNIENIPSGIYFVRLMNSHGEVVVTKKFTKQ